MRNDPTPEEIKQMCSKIQKKWTIHDLKTRAGHLLNPQAEIKEINITEIRDEEASK